MEAQAQVGVWGHLKLAHNSGRISGVQMDVVMEGDRWEFEKGLNPKLLHVPRPDRDLEDIDRIRWVYVVVAADGAQWQPVGSGGTQVEMRAKGVYFDAFNRQWVERIRKRAQSYDSPAWSDWYAEMCMAKALKRVLKSCPKSREMAQAIGMTDELDANLEQGQTWNVDASKVLPANLAVDPKTQAARDAFAGAGKAPGREPEPEAVTVSASPSSSEAQKQEQGPERAGPQPEAGPEKAAPATTGGGLGWDD
jgi:recombination protein RecT